MSDEETTQKTKKRSKFKINPILGKNRSITVDGETYVAGEEYTGTPPDQMVRHFGGLVSGFVKV